MSDYLNPDQIRDLYAEAIDKHAGDPECDTDVRKLRAYEAVDALAAAGLLPIGHDERWGYVTKWGSRPPHLVADVDDVPPPPPAPGKGRGPR